MTSQDYKDRFLVWYNQARFDLSASKLSLDNGYNEWSAFQAVQSVEKALKSIIVYAGVRPPKIHKLQTLIGICNRLNDKFRATKIEFRYLESFTFISRYPFLIPGNHHTPHELIEQKEAQKAYKQAEDLVEVIGEILNNEPSVVSEDAIEITQTYSQEEIESRIKVVVDELKAEFKPEKIILFGRYAREEKVPVLSTMDLLVIADTDLHFIDRIQRAREVTKGGEPIIEPIIYTPQEFKIMTEDIREGFLESALLEGKTIFQA